MPITPFSPNALKAIADDQLAQEQQGQAPQGSNTYATPELAKNARNMHDKVANSGLYRAGQAAFLGTNAADFYTTNQAISDPHLEEKNTLLGKSPISVNAVKGLITAGTLYGMHNLANSGHRKLAGIVGMVSSAIPALAAWHNENLMRSAK